MTIIDYALLALIAIKIAGITVSVYVILWHARFIRETKRDIKDMERAKHER